MSHDSRQTQPFTIEQIIGAIALLPDAEREQLIRERITEHWCIHCGSKYLPCKCTHDE